MASVISDQLEGDEKSDVRQLGPTSHPCGVIFNYNYDTTPQTRKPQIAHQMDPAKHRFCLIVGAGPSGLIQAVEILRNGLLSLEQIVILERNDRFGGTWAQNIYPGAACDIVSNVYQISFYRNPSLS